MPILLQKKRVIKKYEKQGNRSVRKSAKMNMVNTGSIEDNEIKMLKIKIFFS